MNLRRKLLTTFGVLTLLGLSIAGVTTWAIIQWQRTDQLLEEHYERSLLLENIRATTFRAAMEVPEAVTGNDPDSRAEMEAVLEPVDGYFARWSQLADTPEEREEVARVRASQERLVAGANEALDLVDRGRLEESSEFFDERLEDEEFDQFQRVTEQAERADLERRQEIQVRMGETRRTAQLVLIIAAFGTISLLLLLAAYLASDLFKPLKELREALEDVEKGDLNRRLDGERSDELGGVNRAFNGMAESLRQRERSGAMAADSDGSEGNGSTWRGTPSRVTLHRLVSQLRSNVVRLSEDETAEGTRPAGQRELIRQLDGLSQAVARVTEFGFPLDLDLSRTDVRALLYRVFMRFQDEFAERAVSLELEIDPEIGHAVVDKLKLREAVSELVRNALDALPEKGGRLGLRSRLTEDGTELLIEVADDGAGAEQSSIDRAFEPEAHDDGPRTGLALTRAVVEQHGGNFVIESEPGEGTYAQIRLPVRG